SPTVRKAEAGRSCPTRRRRRPSFAALRDQSREVPAAQERVDPALPPVVESAGPVRRLAARGQAREEAANRRAQGRLRVSGVRERELATRARREQAALDWIPAEDERRRGLDRRRAEAKQRRP